MSLFSRIHAFKEWYRALRALNRILATMTALVLLVGARGSDDDGASDRLQLQEWVYTL